jgi:periplasmic divalent cation tolerance protein
MSDQALSDHIILALSSCPDEASARRIAHILVTEGRAACVNRISGVASTYVWEGEVRDESEILLMMKTTAAGLPALQSRLNAIHPYELPEFVAIPLVGGNAAYLAWVRSMVQAKGT